MWQSSITYRNQLFVSAILPMPGMHSSCNICCAAFDCTAQDIVLLVSPDSLTMTGLGTFGVLNEG